MLFYKTVLAAAITLLGLASAAPTSSHHDIDVLSSTNLTNGERIARGMGIAQPRKLFSPTRTNHAAPARRSGLSPGQEVNSIAFQSGSTTKRDLLTTIYSVVVNGQFTTSNDITAASKFVTPDFSNGKTLSSISWVPSVDEGDFKAGEPYLMYATTVNDIVSFGFSATPPADSIADFFAPPSFAGGFSPQFTPAGASTPHEYIWVTDASGQIHLAPDVATALASIDGAKIQTAIFYTPGSVPDFTLALGSNGGDGSFVNPSKLWMTDFNSDRTGYVRINADKNNNLYLAADATQATTFYIPNLSTPSSPQKLIANVDDQTYTLIGTKNGNIINLGTTPGSTTDAITFTIPTSGEGIVGLSYNGDSTLIAGIERYERDLILGSKTDWMYSLPYSSSKICIELVSSGGQPKYCAPYVQKLTYGQFPAGFYARTKDGSVAGYMTANQDGTFGYSATPTSLYIPSYNAYNGIFNVYAPVGDLFYLVSANAIASNTAIGPLFANSGKSNGQMLQIPPNQSGIVKPPKFVGNNQLKLTYHYNPTDKQVYAFSSLANAQAYDPGMVELCIESVLAGAEPGICQAYLETGALDVNEKNPIQLYAREIDAEGQAFEGWLGSTSNTIQIASTQSSAGTWYFPQGPGTELQTYITRDNAVNSVSIFPGTQNYPYGPITSAIPYVNTELTPSTNFIAKIFNVPSLSSGSIVTTQFTFNNQLQTTWLWIYSKSNNQIRLFPDINSARAVWRDAIAVCVETVVVGQQPVGSCAAQHPVKSRSANPVKIYATQISPVEEGHDPVQGWVYGDDQMQVGDDSTTAQTYYLPSGASTYESLYTLPANSDPSTDPSIFAVVNGATSGTSYASGQPSFSTTAQLQSFWDTHFVSTTSISGGGIMTATLNYNMGTPTWGWFWMPYASVVILPDLAQAKSWNAEFVQICLEVVPIDGQPTGACNAQIQS
nr:uncharacterized protein CI109_004405 [Kwoniella shandongensis]KAA5527114.1 hypothetical protein CI109_004405 [Kwoniella shandongensis]